MELHERHGRISRWGGLAVAVVLAAAVSGCGSEGRPDGGAQSPPSVTQAGGRATTPEADDDAPGGPKADAVVAATVHEPIQLVQRPGDDGHLWLAERAGRVRRLAVGDGGRSLEPAGDYVLDLSDQTTVESERGLLGLAFSPDGGVLYVSYTDLQGDTRIVSYEMSGTDVRTSSRKVVFSQEQPFPNHNGGHIVFGPDGKLWLGLGDGGAADDPGNRAQDPHTRLGKVLRIDPATDDVEIVISGVRNPWRYTFDADGALWIGDVGQNAVEEIDRLPADEIDGANLGWSGYEGTSPYLDGDGRRPADPVEPVFEYSHQGGNCSITGGFVYRGEAMPALRGTYLFADYCAGALRAIRVGDDGKLEQELDLGVTVDHPVSFAEDAQGEPYVLSQDGAIVRLVGPS
jgi:glucose/arabinose dehydrogenase